MAGVGLCCRDRKQAALVTKQSGEDRALLKSLVLDLIKDNIVPDEKSISSVERNNYVFTVNVNEQTAVLHQHFKKEIFKKEGV